jgi:hypothetical protein
MWSFVLIFGGIGEEDLVGVVLLIDVDDSLELRVLALLDQKPEGLDMKDAE